MIDRRMTQEVGRRQLAVSRLRSCPAYLPPPTAYRLLLGIIFLFTPTLLQAQEIEVVDTVEAEVDTVRLDEQRVVGVDRPGDVVPPDTVTIDMVAPDHSPRRAALYSAVLPGLGQIYNKKYWKVPIVYAGFGILGYFIIWNNDRYQLFRRERIARQNGQAGPLSDNTRVSESTLPRNVDQFRQQRDQTIIYTAAWYALNIMDAIVDAHLIEFDVNPDLSLKLEPTTGPRLAYRNAPPSPAYAGIAFTLHLK